MTKNSSERIFYLDQDKEVYFKNDFGIIYDNKVKLLKNVNTEFIINEIANFRMIANKNTRPNIIFFTISFCCFLTGYLINYVEYINIILFLISFILFVCSMFAKYNLYAIQIVLGISEQIIIPVKSKEKQNAYLFIKKLEQYRESNEELMMLL